MRLTRIGLVEGQTCQTRLDLVILHEVSLAVESISWSRIKALYRGY
jgi:hypothetical protein